MLDAALLFSLLAFVRSGLSVFLFFWELVRHFLIRANRAPEKSEVSITVSIIIAFASALSTIQATQITLRVLRQDLRLWIDLPGLDLLPVSQVVPVLLLWLPILLGCSFWIPAIRRNRFAVLLFSGIMASLFLIGLFLSHSASL